MENGNIPVVFCPAAIDACALYRMYMPHLNIHDSCFVIPALRLPNGQIAPGGVINVEEIKHCKVAIVQRLVSEHNRNALLTFKKFDMKIVYDLDDDVWNLPSYNPGKHEFSKVRDGFYRCAELADVLTVSTRGLRTAARSNLQLNKEIIIVPNAIDLNLFSRKNIQRNDGFVIIGWGGSNTHSEDVKGAFEAVTTVLDEFPQVRMEIVGAHAENEIIETYIDDNGRRGQRRVKVISKIGKHPQTRFRPWVPVSEYAYRLASWAWDISLAPLEDNRFNRSKSNIKVLEAASLKIPCLASDVQPYREFCELGGADLMWLLCNRTSEWASKLRTLINEPERRDFLGNKMHEIATQWFDIKKTKEIWKHVFRTIV